MCRFLGVSKALNYLVTPPPSLQREEDLLVLDWISAPSHHQSVIRTNNLLRALAALTLPCS